LVEFLKQSTKESIGYIYLIKLDDCFKLAFIDDIDLNLLSMLKLVLLALMTSFSNNFTVING